MSQRKTDRVILTYDIATDLYDLLRHILLAEWTEDRVAAYHDFMDVFDKADALHKKIVEREKNDKGNVREPNGS